MEPTAPRLPDGSQFDPFMSDCSVPRTDYAGELRQLCMTESYEERMDRYRHGSFMYGYPEPVGEPGSGTFNPNGNCKSGV